MTRRRSLTERRKASYLPRSNLRLQETRTAPIPALACGAKARATLNYLKDPDKFKCEKPYTLSLDISLGNEGLRTNLEYETRSVEPKGLRGSESDLSLEAHGFELIRIPSSVMAEWFGSSEPNADSQGVVELLKARFRTEHIFLYDRGVRIPFAHRLKRAYAGVIYVPALIDTVQEGRPLVDRLYEWEEGIVQSTSAQPARW